MATILTQTEADNLFRLEKVPEDANNKYQFPISGNRLIIPCLSKDKKENFHFDVSRGSIKLTKITYQNRARKAYVLRRLDLDGAPHKNPEVETVPFEVLSPYNGEDIPCPHLHIYVEGYGEKWAIPAVDVFNRIDDKEMYDIMFDFFTYCNLTGPPHILNSITNL